MRRRLVLAFSLAACVDVPDDPSWHADVKPILEANCVRCHGAGGPFRLDVLEDTAGDVEIVQGAGSMAPYVAARAADHPESRLRDEQIEVLRRWDGTRGAPRPGNRPPSIARIDADLPDVPNAVLLGYEIADPDREMVTGELRAGPDLARAIVVDRSLRAGRGVAGFSTAPFDEDPLRLWAILDDGAGRVAVDLGEEGLHRTAPVAPRVTVLAPRRLDIVGADAAVVFRVASGDAAFTAELRASRGDETVVVATGVTGVPGAVVTVPWDTRGLAEDTWQLTITVADASASGGVAVADLRISHATTTDTWDAIRADVLGPRCGACHDFTHDEVRARAGLLHHRVAVAADMPPVSAGADLADAERDRLRAWLLAGAP